MVKPVAGYRPLAYSSPEAVQTTGTVAGIATRIGNHSFRATGITVFRKLGGSLEKCRAYGDRRGASRQFPRVVRSHELEEFLSPVQSPNSQNLILTRVRRSSMRSATVRLSNQSTETVDNSVEKPLLAEPKCGGLLALWVSD